jgi:hypothetical protein
LIENCFANSSIHLFLPQITVMNIEHIQEIDKELVEGLHFPMEEVLTNDEYIADRKRAVQRAISLGNLEHQKVKIYFADEAGEKMVHTTIWAVTDEAIVLKKSVIIPIQRILKLEI